MTLKEKVLARVEPFNALSVVVVDRQDTRDIVTGVLDTHQEQKAEYDKICLLFDEPTAYETGQKIWSFLRDNVRYNEETEDYQTLRTPAAILVPGVLWGADCKNYSLFTAGILDALNRRGAQIPLAFRFARYDGKRRGQPTHVFVVMYPGSDDEIWVDPVLSRYDYHKQPTSYTDKIMLAKLSGIPGQSRSSRPAGRRTAKMGQGDGDDGDDIYYDSVTDDIPSGDGGGSSDSDTAGFTFSSTSTGLSSQSGSDITDNPSSGATSLTPTDAGNFSYNESTGQYEPVNAEGQNTVVDQNAGSSSSSGNFFSNLLSEITGGGSGSGSGSSGGAGSSLSTGKSATSSQPTNSTSPVVVTTGSNNTVLYVVAGVAVLGLIIALTSKK